jgi:hypothetical protein
MRAKSNLKWDINPKWMTANMGIQIQRTRSPVRINLVRRRPIFSASLFIPSLPLPSLIYSMWQNPSWEANRFLASQGIPHILWNPKVHYSVYRNPPSILILSQINPVHVIHPTSWLSILILSSHLRPGLPRFYNQNFSSIRAMCPAHLILLDLVTRIIFVE